MGEPLLVNTPGAQYQSGPCGDIESGSQGLARADATKAVQIQVGGESVRAVQRGPTGAVQFSDSATSVLENDVREGIESSSRGFWNRWCHRGDMDPGQVSTPRRIQSMIDSRGSVLNRGLGGVMPSLRHRRRAVHHSACDFPTLLLFFGALVTIPCVCLIDIHLVSRDSIWKPKPDEEDAIDPKWGALIYLATIPLTCAGINFLVQHIRRTTFWWDRDDANRRWRMDPIASKLSVVAFCALLRSACDEAIDDRISDHVDFCLKMAIATILLTLFYALLDKADGVIKGMVEEQEAINGTAPVAKMQDIVSNISRSNRPDRDFVYCFARTNTVPAEVLSYVWWVYYIIGKVGGALVPLAMLFIGIDDQTIVRCLVGGTLISVATSGAFVVELGPNTLSLFRLALNKPFYVGDLVTLNRNGSMGESASSIMGFVENITMMYVVVRNFEMKQTWIPHKEFNSMIIQNWTRRPTKTVLLNMGISSRCPVAKVEELVTFGKKWIEASHEIQQKNYQKCHITKIANGYNIEIIFFPLVGVTHRGIRQKFLVAFMAFAERLQIPFVPLQLQQNFCPDEYAGPFGGVGAAAGHHETRWEDLMPDPTDNLPKGVGLGFRAFPPGAGAV